MATWKELGEVPDSDDDDSSLDSPGLDISIVPADEPFQRVTDKPAPNAPASKAKSVWDIPESSQEDELAADWPPITTKPSSPRLRKTTPRPFVHSPTSTLSSPLSSPPEDDIWPVADAEISLSAPREAQEALGGGPELSVQVSTPSSVVNGQYEPNKLPKEQKRDESHESHAAGSGTRADLEERATRQIAIQYERTLRPRKPIQEHPYLLEGAQYANVLKSHGVKPIRVATDSDRGRRRREEEDSQEQDFEASQVSTGSRVSGLSKEISLSAKSSGVLDEPNVSRLSSSPRTSPNHQGGTSSASCSANQTDNISVFGDDDDLPPLSEIFQQPPRSTQIRRAKHKSSPQQSSRRKRLRRGILESSPVRAPTFRPPPPNIYELSSSPSPSSTSHIRPACSGSATPQGSPRLVGSLDSPEVISLHSSQQPSGPTAANTVLHIDPESDNDLENLQETDLESGSESGSDLVRTVGRRIRGVLPASWLRLDQKVVRDKVRQNVYRSHLNPIDEQGPRRGVAQPRQGQALASAAPLLPFEDSEEEETSSRRPETEAPDYIQTRIVLEEDDTASVIESDSIDPMFPARKRRRLSGSHHRLPKQMKSSALRQGASSLGRKRQPKITSMINTSKSSSSTARKSRTERLGTKAPYPSTHRNQNRLARHAVLTPPRLSILDVITSDAPLFLKIAARAAKRQPGLGKSSPRRKTIRLATRRDTVDAMSVIRDWNMGKIQPRVSQSSRQVPAPAPVPLRPALQQISQNMMARGSRSGQATSNSVSALLGISGQSNQSRLAAVKNNLSSATRESLKTPRSNEVVVKQRSVRLLRPAQLETNEVTQPKRMAFSAQKRALDALFRQAKRMGSGPSTPDGFEGYPTDDKTAHQSPSPIEDAASLITEDISREGHIMKGRLKKKAKPQCVDLTAPRYVYAGDPLPSEISSPVIVDVHSQERNLLGLQPLGTHYTQHFDVFPLDQGVFFHETTLIGGGCLETVSAYHFTDKLRHSRPRIFLELGGLNLRWGQWNDQVSSELGILIDWIVEKLLPRDLDIDSVEFTEILRAAGFVVEYIENSLGFPDDATEKAFIGRILEIFGGLQSRLLSLQTKVLLDKQKEALVEVLVRSIVVVRSALQICRQSPELVGQIMPMENLLKGLTRVCIQQLLDMGFEGIRNLYGDLQHLAFRERGIRKDKVSIHSWVVVMRVLDIARIPRASFWDILYSILWERGLATGSDARIFEQLWHNMFTLLPLCEFDNSGVIIPGQRYQVRMDGWALPQQILKRVFQLYKDNSRQAPGFNDYCRALVGRCHYLVRQWGWTKCNGIIGVIFDFFGSQDLAHLRNEEVYRSPRFLDELHENPSLSVEVEDRCFHIFLKLLALAIKQLRESDSVKEIQNLVARTMPNHNRQYLKEHQIHQHDLAALRNHHDLLCTLYWAAPADAIKRNHISIIQGLVIPADSHKEACLINLRAWNQLARFVASSSEHDRSFKPFQLWGENVFRQLIKQFDGVESDIQQQFLALSADVSKAITEEMMDSMVSINKKAVLSMLHFSVNASLDVAKHSQSLDMATSALRSAPLALIFQHFFFSPPSMSWTILRNALTALDLYIDRLEHFQAEESQNDPDHMQARYSDDAIMMLDDEIAGDFFSMARCVLSNADQGRSEMFLDERSLCVEQITALAAKLATRFIRFGVLRTQQLFTQDKYGLFEAGLSKLDLGQRQYLSLFVAVLLEQGVADLTGIGSTLLELWIASIVKPRKYLSFENRLAQQLCLQGCAFVPEGVVGPTLSLDYSLSKDLFYFALTWMRTSLNESNASLRKQLSAEFRKTLDLVMGQMKVDLKTISRQITEHRTYVQFVRDIISAIRTHGAQICQVDEFFFHVSQEYSPSAQDPRLHIAGILSYGVRLNEGDGGVISQLFYYLYSNFTAALANDKLGDEIGALWKGMRNGEILSFVLRSMLPAVIRVTAMENRALPILDVYSQALRHLLTGSIVPPVVPEEDLPNLVNLLSEILVALGDIAPAANAGLSSEQIHITARLVSIMQSLRLTFDTLSYTDELPESWKDIEVMLKRFSLFTLIAGRHLDEVLDGADSGSGPTAAIFQGLGYVRDLTITSDRNVNNFAEHIAKEIRKTTGFNREPEAIDDVLRNLRDEIRRWNFWWEGKVGSSSQTVSWEVTKDIII